MPIPSSSSFIASYVDHIECELRAVGPDIVAYIPDFASAETIITLGTASFITADAMCKAMGLKPNYE